MNQTVTQAIGKEYKSWSVGDNIIMDMAMGRGKTFFIVYILGEYAECNNMKILYLCNRSKLAEETFTALKETWTRNITVKTYQTMQKAIEKRENVDVYDYVVCDECHYLLTDGWNDKTDIMYNWLKNNKFTCKVFMSATGHNIFPIIKRWAEYKEYILNPDYSYIKKLVFYDNDSYIDRVINSLRNEEKVIYFSRKISNAYNVYERYKTKASFICSQHTKSREFKQYITQGALVDGVLKNKITITTSVWDNGINIKDSGLKHIICDMEDLIILIQALGRKRVGKATKDGFILSDDDNITLHIRNWNKQDMTRFINPKQATYTQINKYINDDIQWITEQQHKRDKRINDCLYIDYEAGKVKLNYLRYVGLEKEIKRLKYAKKYGFDKYVLDGLGETFKGEVEYVLIEGEKKKSRIETYLSSRVGDKLYKEEQKRLAEIINVKRNGKLLKSVEAVISGIKDENIPYTITGETDWNRKLDDGNKNPMYGKVYWMIIEKVA